MPRDVELPRVVLHEARFCAFGDGAFRDRRGTLVIRENWRGGRARLIDSSAWRIFWPENIQKRFHHAVCNHAYAASRRFRQISNPSGHERAAIVDHDLHTALVLEIGDAHARAERQRSVRHSERRGIEPLAAGCFLAREFVAIHRNAAALLRAYRSVARR